jgi:4-hydroxy-3-methylbut-2-en-1-yl diphosphate synthase IspG/GcpE
MTTTDTNDTEACVAQSERIIKAGGELVRLTTQGTREAENLKNINAGIRAKGFSTPIVADVHFNPNVADVAARYAEKVRVNPGNYVDPHENSSNKNIPTRSTPSKSRRSRSASCPSSISVRNTTRRCASA